MRKKIVIVIVIVIVPLEQAGAFDFQFDFHNVCMYYIRLVILELIECNTHCKCA